MGHQTPPGRKWFLQNCRTMLIASKMRQLLVKIVQCAEGGKEVACQQARRLGHVSSLGFQRLTIVVEYSR